MLPTAMPLCCPAIPWCNQINELFGYSRGALIGQTGEILIPQRLRAAHIGLRTEFVEDPSARAMGAGRDLQGLRRDGTDVGRRPQLLL